MIANTLRLELVDLAALPPAVTAFIGALTAGLLASLLKNKVGYPRISVTVPSIVIMVPGLYLYRGFYNLGIMSLSVSASWFAAALLIIAALPLGLIFARILTDKRFGIVPDRCKKRVTEGQHPCLCTNLKKITFPIYREDAIMEETKIILFY